MITNTDMVDIDVYHPTKQMRSIDILQLIADKYLITPFLISGIIEYIGIINSDQTKARKGRAKGPFSGATISPLMYIVITINNVDIIPTINLGYLFNIK